MSVKKQAAMNHYIPVLEGRIALTSFSLSLSSLIVLVGNVQPWTVAIIEIVYIALLALFYSKQTVKVILISHALGIVFAIGIVMALSGEHYMYFGIYAMALSFFHMSEYVTTSIFNSDTLSTDSFLVNHSREYTIAALASWLEYCVEYCFFPNAKGLHLVAITGALLVIFGETLRKLAMFTAGSNFTHIVQYRKKDDHELVTSGVYSFFRHPSYVGWFYWSVGTQVLLCNPVCSVAYVAASWMFFNERIFDEEEMLIQFFKDDYVQYKKTVGTGIPGISGYPLERVPHLLNLVSVPQ